MTRTLLIRALVLAFVTTVGVAWISAWLVDAAMPESTRHPYPVSRRESPMWQFCHYVGNATSVGVLSAVGVGRASEVQTAAGPSWSRVQSGPPTSADVNAALSALFEDARGWPMLCLRSAQRGDATFTRWVETENGIRLPLTQGMWRQIPRALPLRPMWIGLLVNIAFFTICFIVVQWRVVRARSNLRVRRGVCVKCAYPIGSSLVCTECGAALPATRK